MAEDVDQPDADDMLPDEQAAAIVHELSREAKRREDRRRAIENRWIEDLRQYHGLYDEDTERRLLDAATSAVFMNATRPFCRRMESRLCDMLFPTDDRNWAIEPTPDPDLHEAAQAAMREARRLRAEADAEAEAAAEEDAMAAEAPPDEMAAAPLPAQAPPPGATAPLPEAPGGDMAGLMAGPVEEPEPEPEPPLDEQAAAAEEEEAAYNEVIEEARQRAWRMERAIDDLLTQSAYADQAKRMIRDAVRLGAGILKGPVTGMTMRRGWVEQEGGGYRLEMQADDQPVVRHVDPWSFFPDPDARSVDESDGFFQRHLLNEKGLRRLADLPGFDGEAIRALLEGDVKNPVPSYMNSLRGISGDEQQAVEPIFHVWEYSGPLAAEKLAMLYEAQGDEEALSDMGKIDHLAEENVVLWFCEDRLLKIAPHPMDSGESLYSVFQFEADEASIWGYGIPSIIRHEQRAVNAAWRMLMDNAGLGAGPMIVIDRDQIEPLDGDWVLRPRKIWSRKKGGAPRDAAPFEQHQINVNTQELAGILELTDRQMQVATAMPDIAQGEPGTGVQQTATGTALLMSSANVIFRDVVRAFDDQVTVPTLRRLYDWLMQHAEDDNLKGDMQVKPRGASVLLVREMQTANLTQILAQIGQDPELAGYIRKAPILRRLIQSLMLSADEIVLTDDEIEQQQSAAGAEEDPEIELRREELRIKDEEQDLRSAIANMENARHIQVAKMSLDGEMIRLAESQNMKLEELRAKLDMQREKQEFDERQIAAEIAMRNRTGVSSGGRV